MKKKASINRKRTIAYIALGVLAAAVLVVGYMALSSNIRKKATDVIYTRVEDYSEQSALFLNLYFSDGNNSISAISNSINFSENANGWVDEIESVKQILNFASSFERIDFYDTNGNSVSDTSLSNQADKNFFISGVNGMSGVSKENLDGVDYLCTYAPLKKREEVVGVLCGKASLDEIIQSFDFNSFEGKGFSSIVESNGTVLMHLDTDAREYHSDLFEYIDASKLSDGYTRARIENDMIQGMRGIFIINTDGERNIFCYYPIGIDNFYVVTIVPTEVIDAQVASLGSLLIQLGVILAIAIAVILTVVIIINISSRREINEAKTQLEVINHQYQLALNHVSCYLFEYDITQKTLRFQDNEAFQSLKIPTEMSNIPDSLLERGMVDETSLEDLQSLIKHVKKGIMSGDCIIKLDESWRENTWYRVTIIARTKTDIGTERLTGTIKNISDEKKAEMTLAQEKKYRDAMIEEADSIFIADLNKGVVTYQFNRESNEEFSKDVPIKDVLKTQLNNLTFEDYDKTMEFFSVENFREAFGKGENKFEMEYRVQNDQTEWHSCSVSLLSDPKNDHILAFCYIKEITEKKKAELTLKRQAENDSLTGLYNRMYAQIKIDETLSQPFDLHLDVAQNGTKIDPTNLFPSGTFY